MSEPVESWWARRQFSRGADVPYPIGRYREAWASYPALVRQYHHDLNNGIMLSQIPPAAEVFLRWQCDAGHIFVATPTEQRTRPGRQRRKSSWCPECLQLAQPGRAPVVLGEVNVRSTPKTPRPPRPVCGKTPNLRVGEPFVSVCAPKPASAAEGSLRYELAERLEFDGGFTAVRLARPFFDHLEAWPDILLPELRVAIEYDTIGRFGLEHVGGREATDRRKDRALRSAGWEVVRIRTAPLLALGPHDLLVTGLSRKVYPRLLEELRDIRGPLMVDAYLK
ncbi:hypothetical protein ACFSBZ_04665 [Amnibacterium flavum]|uniref:Zinc-ribbon domain-containing protein n=1 Tax=Amnibacterium flavum TaxID=2173173 RepID=A0A2V1HVN7_9MICO|nr:hypothetical protein [Amnibacterium flavum]PVZ94224.1 hypothetical protein DDQ50_10805 [Amnibacterium flavum]